jgi:hypothetical protein
MNWMTRSHLRFLTRFVIGGALFSSITPFLGCGGPPHLEPPPKGLIGWWSAEGNGHDRTGTCDGTLHGAAAYAPGKVGQAFSFDPESGTMIVPDSTGLRLSHQLTIEAWINTRNINTGQAIVSKVGGVTGDNGFQFVVSGNTLVGEFNSPGEDWPSARVTSPGLIATGVWYHVVWTYDQSAMVLYLDGLPVATNVIEARTIAACSSNLCISGDDNRHVYFDGLIDEPSLYDRAPFGCGNPSDLSGRQRRKVQPCRLDPNASSPEAEARRKQK